MTVRPELRDLFQQMSDLTHSKCGECRAPRSCCSVEYCYEAMHYASTKGVTLTPTEHPTLPMMGATGCIVEPHLRPLCTLHVCEQHYMKDAAFAEAYFDLRMRITTVVLEDEANRLADLLQGEDALP